MQVSKAWQALVFDGQMWAELDVHPFPRMPTSLLLRLTQMGGPFIRHLDVSGHANLASSTLLDVTDNLCLRPAPDGSLAYTQLTSVNLQGCSALTTRSLHHLLIRSPSLQSLSLKGLCAVTNTTCDVLAVYCSQLTSLDLSRCAHIDGEGVRALAAAALSRGAHLLLKELRLAGLRHVNDTTMATLGKAAPYLEVLDLSYARTLHNSALEAFVACADTPGLETVLLTAREAGRDPGDAATYRRRVTRLRHLALSACVLLTDIACAHLAHTVPRLELLELAGIGAELRDAGLVHLLATTPHLRRLDLEDACEITDAVLATLTPAVDPRAAPAPAPGHALEHLVISYATHVGDGALLALVRGCARLCVLEADNTRVSGAVLREFVRLARERRRRGARVVAVDCRGVGESLVRELAGATRPRAGWRAHAARRLRYVDALDGAAEQDECDEQRVVLKTFYSWQAVDAVRAAREKRRKATSRRAANESGGNVTEEEDMFAAAGRARWWSPSGRRAASGSGRNSPPEVADTNNDRDGCRLM